MAELTHLAFEEAYRRVFPMILAKCRRMIADTAESQDLAQEVFVRLWQSRQKISEPRALTAWLYRTCTHLAIDRLRSRGRREQVFASLAAADDGLDGGDPERLSANRRALTDVASRIPESELEMAMLHRVDGLGHAEIAEVLGIGERTVRRALRRFAERVAEIRAVPEGAR
jgi:RNA polymerase sigma-70 factor (ECF subfamily)